ncbi:MAG: hypothetical protein M5U26_30470 [Planctomycetota bacterium]|nr:hypothetical protein [Planctomycetota bacterium]
MPVRFLLLACLGSCLAPRGALAAEPEPAAAPEHAAKLLGCWQAEDPKFRIRFEPRRAGFDLDGEVQACGVSYEAGAFTTVSMGRARRFAYAFDGETLRLDLGDGARNWTRLARVPETLNFDPLPLGEAKALPAERVKALQEELLKRGAEDQAVRTNPERRADWSRVDAENTAWLMKLVQEVGWIDAERFGPEVSNQAFLLVQHSMNPRLMQAALPEIEKDTKAGSIDAQSFALLHDRLSLMLGGKQRFGTQIGANEQGEAVVLPLEDRAKVEQLRKEIGLFPLKDYLAMFEKMGRGKVKFADDE